MLDNQRLTLDLKVAQSEVFKTRSANLRNPSDAYDGKNNSSIRLDLLKDTRSGEIYADKELIYQKGKFTF